MKLSEKELKVQLTEIVNDVLAEAHLKKGDLFVLGCSTSEVVGGHIGKIPVRKLVSRSFVR